jgi:sec-independent protein translocase protein TatB
MSFSHLLLLGIIAIIVIPPDKLPEVARQVAKFLGEMRRMTSGVFDDLKNDIILKPEDLLKQKESNTIHQQAAPAPATAPVVETKSAEDEYAKHIQDASAATNDTEKKPT